MTPNERESFGSPVCFDLHNLLPIILPQRRRGAEEKPRIRGKFGERLNRCAESFQVCLES